MSLARVKSALLAADFKPHTLTLGAGVEYHDDLVSPGAKEVLRLIGPRPAAPTPAEHLSGDAWSNDAMRRYWSLKQDERMEVLGLAGFYVHELMHKIDFLTTPFGVSFYGRACLEAMGIQDDGRSVLDELEGCADGRPMRDLPRRGGEQARVRDGPAALIARVLWFDSLRGAAPRHVEPGWGGNTGPVPVLNHRLQKVTVHDVTLSVALPEGGGYLRPLTILESRAVSATALHLFARLGGKPDACAEIAHYIRTFYEPRDAYADYRFLLDLYAGVWRESDFPAAVEAHDVSWLRTALTVIMVVGWYALHAPPLMPNDGDLLANSSAVVRLLVGLMKLEDSLREGRAYGHGVGFLDAIDTSDMAQELGLQPGREVLSYCVAYVNELREMNLRGNREPALREHFDRIFDIQAFQLSRRAQRGYTSMLGMPDGGHLLGGFEDDADRQLLLGAYDPPAPVQRWFRLREDLLFGYARRTDFWTDVRNCLTPAVEHSDDNDADPRQVFLQHGLWTSTSGELELDENGQATPFVGVPHDRLSVTFARHRAGEGDDVTVVWQALTDPYDPLFALEVNFPGSGERLRLIFSYRLHRYLVEHILRTRRVGLLCLGDPAATTPDEQPTLINLPVTNDSRPVVAALALVQLLHNEADATLEAER